MNPSEDQELLNAQVEKNSLHSFGTSLLNFKSFIPRKRITLFMIKYLRSTKVQVILNDKGGIVEKDGSKQGIEAKRQLIIADAIKWIQVKGGN